MSDRKSAGGLASAEAAALLAAHGYNELPSAKPRPVLGIAWSVVKEPMFVLLLAAATIYLVLGDVPEAVLLFGSVFVVVGITFHQERKMERALEALRQLSSPSAKVRRDGAWRQIPAREIVVGDHVMVKEGERIPADALLVESANLMVDESLLTGESAPVGKRAATAADVPMRPGGDDLPAVYSGTLITRGRGIARVTATGIDTEVGRIGKALEAPEPGQTRLQRDMRRGVVIFATIGMSLCVIVTVLFGFVRHDWLNGLLAGITLAMANLPEEFPVVLTVFMALGAWRIAREGVLTRRASAIEALGSTTVLCVDKTGTITQNAMTVSRLWPRVPPADARVEGGAGERELILTSMLASERQPFDPMETAYHRLAAERIPDQLESTAGWTLLHSYPLTPEQLSVAHVWQPGDPGALVVAAKGAPEAIAALCRLDDAEHAALRDEATRMANAGLRVLAVAAGSLPHGDTGRRAWPATQGELPLRLVGLTGLMDPIRATVPDALNECYGAGIRVMMITGDYPGTAASIARQVGLAAPDRVLTGAEVEAMADAELANRIGDVNVFARVMPEQKLRLVRLLQQKGEIVTMTGDGVNDAPALKAADIGVAMGKRGSDVAREASDLVLLDDDFTSLVKAVRLGRSIFTNIQKAACYIIAVHVPTAGIALLPLVLGWPLVMYPAHIVFLELVIDPACSIAFEAEPPDRDLMKRPPRPRDAGLFDRTLLVISFVQGGILLVAVALLYAMELAAGTPENEARAVTFSAVVFGNIGLILSNRSRHYSLATTLFQPNRAMWGVIGFALALLALTLYVEPVARIFRFAPPAGVDLVYAAVAASSGVIVLEIYKWLRSLRASATLARA